VKDRYREFRRGVVRFRGRHCVREVGLPPFHLLEALLLRARAVACDGCEVPGMRAQFWCQAETLVTGR